MNFKEVLEILKSAKNIAIVTHETPDGDAIGSSTAMYLALKQLNIKSDLIIKEYAKVFDLVKVLEESIQKPRDVIYDVVIVLDSATINRINEKDILTNAKTIINIDHHVSNNNYGTYNLVEGKNPACCQLMYDVIKQLGAIITKEIAESLLVGIITDTSGFRNNSTNKETFIYVANLLDLGVDLSSIYRKVLTTTTKSQFELRKTAENRLEFFEDNKIAFTYLTKKDLENASASLGDHEGIVDIGRSIEGVEVSIFMYERNNGYKISLRSNHYVNVSEIGILFNGGGHIFAAGFDSELPLSELKEKLIKEISKRL